MMDRSFPIFGTRRRVALSATLGLLIAPTAITLSVSRPAYADVVGRLRFVVTAKADGKPIAEVKITLHDSANVRPDLVLTTGADGTVISPPLENRDWRSTIDNPKYQIEGRITSVVADATTDVVVTLEPVPTGSITVRAARNLIRTTDTSNSTRRDTTFFVKNPVNVGNKQSLSQALRAVPGFVQDSVNQVHPRAEHSQTSIYINGFLVPGALQGRAGQFLAPDTIQTLDVQTGGFAPEYGGELAAVLNLTLRAGTIEPFSDVQLGGGSFNTFQGIVTVGGQAGPSLGDSSKRFSYLFNATQRNTDNGLEAPQPDQQTTHNHQDSSTIFGNFDYKLNERDSLTLVINSAPARSEIANRTGLSDKYAPFGQGYGYAGLQTSGSTTTDAAGNTVPLLSQEAAGQDVYQKDNNTFGALLYRKNFSDNATGQFSIGASRSQLDVLNNSRGIDLSALPEDSSIEFNPTIKRRTNNLQFQANVTVLQGPSHTVKFGGLYNDIRGDESYRLIPGSQAAVDALYQTDSILAPTGGTLTQNEDGTTTYSLPTGGAYNTPTVNVHRTGHYAAGYAQDTWKLSRRFTANYGLRLDNFKASQNLGQSSIDKTELSPRVNLAYVVAPMTVLRGNYNRLFTQPPLAQGAIIGQSIDPQIVNLYEASIERQFGATQSAKIAYYEKDFKNVTDTGILIEGTQIGVYTTHNLERAVAKGLEVSYNLQPRGGVGTGAYVSWANATDKPSGRDSSTGEELPIGGYTDHDALNTISTGVNYTLNGGAFAGVNVYYTTGVESSRLIDLATGEPGKRQERTEVNLVLSSPRPGAGKKGIGAEFAVENLFDSRKVINFQSAFSGTRFQQGRRLLLNLTGRF